MDIQPTRYSPIPRQIQTYLKQTSIMNISRIICEKKDHFTELETYALQPHLAYTHMEIGQTHL